MADINVMFYQEWRNIFRNASDGIIEMSGTKYRALFHTIPNCDGFSELATFSYPYGRITYCGYYPQGTACGRSANIALYLGSAIALSMICLLRKFKTGQIYTKFIL